MMDDDDDLFAVRPVAVATATTPAPVKRRIAKTSFPAEMLKTPAGIVAAFSCVCGAQDEVLEPAPLRVDCWACKRPEAMRRWQSQYDPPPVNARATTPEERARLP